MPNLKPWKRLMGTLDVDVSVEVTWRVDIDGRVKIIDVGKVELPDNIQELIENDAGEI